MKHLVFILALLVIAPSITCRAQATFKQAFINMPLASESSPDLQPMGTPFSNPGMGAMGALVLVSGIALFAPALFLLQDSLGSLSNLDSVFFTGIVSILGIGGIITGVILLVKAI